MQAVIREIDGRVHVSVPFNLALKEAIKAVPTSKWEGKPLKTWSFTKTPAVIRALKATLIKYKVTPRGAVGLLDPPDGKVAQVQLDRLAGPAPWDHQVAATHKIATSFASYIHGGMGVGKTRSVVDAVVNYDLLRVLVLCPSSVVRVWPGEFDKYAGGQVQIVALDRGTVPKRTEQAKKVVAMRDATSSPVPVIVVINYEAAWRKAFAEFVVAQDWDLIVFDEVHRIKAADGVTSKFCATLRDRAKRITGLSGTPMPHGPGDVYAQFRALDPGIFGTSLTRFRAQYEAVGFFVHKPDASPPWKKLKVAIENDETFADTWNNDRPDLTGKGFGIELSLAMQCKGCGFADQEIVDTLVAFRRDQLKKEAKHYGFYISLLQRARPQDDEPVKKWKNLDDLRRRMDTITMRIDRSVLTLPPAVDAVRKIQLEKEERRVHAKLEHELVVDIAEGRVTAKNALTRLLKLQQAVCGFVKTDDGMVTDIGESRRKALCDVFEDLRTDVDPFTGVEGAEPSVVFCRFHRDLDNVGLASQEVYGVRALELSGRRNELAEWQAGGPPVLAVQIQAGGLGVDLTRAAYALYYSIGFSLGDYEQAKARIHRPGQERPVTHLHMEAEGSFDSIVYRALADKRDVVTYVLDVLGRKAVESKKR